jgi:hypothetical protein
LGRREGQGAALNEAKAREGKGRGGDLTQAAAAGVERERVLMYGRED